MKFNCLPANYVDPSWLTSWLSPAQLSAIRLSPAATESLNRFLLEQPELLDEVTAESFADPMLQLLLLGETLNQVVFYAGLALNHHRIKHVICGQKQRDLKKTLGTQGYRFALERAQFMVGSLCEFISPDKWEFQGGKGTKADLTDSGLSLLALASHILLEPARQRMLYFFHKDDAEKIQTRWLAGFHPYVKNMHQLTDVRERAQALLLKIAQEINPQWKPVIV